MAVAAKKKEPFNGWGAKNRRLRVGLTKLGWSDDDYRNFLSDRFGKTSSKQLKFGEMNEFIDHLAKLGAYKGYKPKRAGKAARSAKANAGTHAKIRALWITLWNLGLLADPSDAALSKFVAGQTKTANDGKGVDRLEWLHPGLGPSVIEALKDWATREGGVCWDSFQFLDKGSVQNPRARVIAAQYAMLVKLDAAEDRLEVMISRILNLKMFPGLLTLKPEQADTVIATLGERIRAAKQQQQEKQDV